MHSLDPNLLFFGNSVDASEKLAELEQFLEYVSGFLFREARYLDEKAHPDLTREFLPLFADTLPPILHSSIVISTTTLLEQEMRGYAAALLSSLRSKLKFGELSGSVLERFRVVTTKIAGFAFDDFEASWQDVVGLFEIRNCLVHAGGDLGGFQKASTIRTFSKKHSTPIFADDSVEIDLRTSEVALRIASVFLDHIYNLALDRFPGRYAPSFLKPSPRGQSGDPASDEDAG
jgi:hypothetical protein|tara:strand:- start:186 stop:881 length:696 start_codon:yes stop_codon:yes gene_type:complete